MMNYSRAALASITIYIWWRKSIYHDLGMYNILCIMKFIADFERQIGSYGYQSKAQFLQNIGTLVIVTLPED